MRVAEASRIENEEDDENEESIEIINILEKAQSGRFL